MSHRYDITIEQGATYSAKYQYLDPDEVTPINLTGYTSTAQVRSTHDASSVLLALTCSIEALTGTITVAASNTLTAALTAPGEGVWDLLLTSPNGAVTRLLEGQVSITPGVTRG